VMISWIEAHSTLTSIHHVGNRCADFAAKRACTGRPLASIKPLSLDQEEGWLWLRCAVDGVPGAPVLGDPRRHCMRVLRTQAVDRWSASNSQSLFSSLHVDVRALWRHVLSSHPTLANFALRMLSDTLQWHIRDGVHEERECQHSRCTREALGIKHLVGCYHARPERAGATVAIYNALAPHGTLGDTLHSWSTGDCLRQILVDAGVLVAVSKAAEVAAMVGIFDSSRVKKVLARAGVEQHLRDPLVLTLRSILINWAARAWRRLFDC